MKRQLDGTFRSVRQPVILSAATLRARWVEAEALALKCMGLYFEEIANHISRVGRGHAKPITPLPDNITFEPNYTISRQACQKAFKKAIGRESLLSAKEFRRLFTMRCESMLRNLQPGIREGDPQAVGVGLRVLEFEAKINGQVPSAKMKFIAQEEDANQVTKSRAEEEADAARHLDLFRGAVQILVDLGVPLPEVQSKAIETTATLVEEFCQDKNGTV